MITINEDFEVNKTFLTSWEDEDLRKESYALEFRISYLGDSYTANCTVVHEQLTRSTRGDHDTPPTIELLFEAHSIEDLSFFDLAGEEISESEFGLTEQQMSDFIINEVFA